MNAMKTLRDITNKLPILCLLILVLSVSACGPELSLKGDKVNLGNVEETSHCRLLGNTRIVLGAKFLSQKTMENFLSIEARNFAARIGGDTVLALGAIENGGQIFSIYNCQLSERRN